MRIERSAKLCEVRCFFGRALSVMFWCFIFCTISTFTAITTANMPCPPVMPATIGLQPPTPLCLGFIICFCDVVSHTWTTCSLVGLQVQLVVSHKVAKINGVSDIRVISWRRVFQPPRCRAAVLWPRCDKSTNPWGAFPPHPRLAKSFRVFLAISAILCCAFRSFWIGSCWLC